MQATRLADDLGRRFPQDTIVQFNYLPSIHAVILLRSKNYLKATEVLQKAAPYELGGNIQTLNFVLYPVYLRGEAYLAAKQGAAAAAEFQKIIDHPGAVRSEPIGALARLELGRALVIAGDPAKAKTAYQEFFTLWENADPDIPLLRQARTEYTMLL
jgi:tetratricopeptide (TPR) repeat protein